MGTIRERHQELTCVSLHKLALLLKGLVCMNGGRPPESGENVDSTM